MCVKHCNSFLLLIFQGLLAIELNWSAIEICSITICFCIPSFLALIRLSPRLTSLFKVSLISNRSKASTRVRKSYPLTGWSKWSRNSGHNTIITGAMQSDEETLNGSQVDILASGLQNAEEENSLGSITVVRSVRVDHSNISNAVP
jgi:hypothetical protein